MKRLKQITIIDDNKIFVFLTSKLIENTNLVNEISCFENGLDAINFIKENATKEENLPEIILLDLSMPIMDGWQFLDLYVKAAPSLAKKITLYIVSSSISPDDVNRAKSIDEVSDYIVKPITQEKLTKIISEVIPIHLPNKTP